MEDRESLNTDEPPQIHEMDFSQLEDTPSSLEIVTCTGMMLLPEPHPST